MLHSGYTVWWLVLALLVLAVELFAVFRRGAGGTLSEHFWKLRRHTWFRLLAYPLLTWLLWHFPFGGGGPLDWRDAAAAAAGIALALAVSVPPSNDD